MPAPNRIDQVTVPGALREDIERIRILEAVPVGGIQFDTDPQEGDWLLLTFKGNPTPHYALDIESDWGVGDAQSLLVGINATVSNPAVGQCTGLQVTAENQALSGTELSTGISGQATSDGDNGVATGVSAGASASSVAGTAIAYEAGTGSGGPAKTRIGLSTDACIRFAPQPVASVPVGGSDAILFLKVVAGVFSLVADVNGTQTVLAVG